MSTADATEAASPAPGPGGSTTTPSASEAPPALPSADSASLLTLPAHMLQHILVSAGRGAEGAVRACRQLHDAFRHALRCPPLMAAFIRGRCASDPAGALWAYRPQVRAALVGHRLPLPAHWSDPVPEPPPGPEADCAQLALMQALAAVEGASFLRSPSSLLAAATRARHLLTLSWLTSGPAGGGGGPWAHALSAISPRSHGGEALLVAVVECRCPHLAACLLEAGVSARARDNEALIAACRQPGPGPAAPGGGGCDSGADGAGCDVEEEGQDRDRDPQLALVRLLLKHGADPRARGSLALTEAVRCGNAALVRLLLAAGANPLGADSRALREAAAAPQPRPELVRLLLEAGSAADALVSAALAAVCSPPPPLPPPPSPLAQGKVPGRQAAADGLDCASAKEEVLPDPPCGAAAAAAGATATATSGQQCSCPVLQVRLQVAEMLLAAGAQPTAAAITAAARWEGGRGLPLVRLLLAARVEAAGPGRVSWLLADGSALRAACRGGCVALVRELLAAGSAVDSGALRAAVEGGCAARTAALEAATAAISLAALRGGPYRVDWPCTGDSDDEGEGEEEGAGRGRGQGVSGTTAAERAEFEALLARVAAAAAGPGEAVDAGRRGASEGSKQSTQGQGRVSGTGNGAATAAAAASPARAHGHDHGHDHDHDAVVALLLGAGADPMAEHGQVFLAAVRAGRWRMVGAMCAVPARRQQQQQGVGLRRLQVMVGMCNELPLKDAARLGWRRVVALLLAAGAGAEAGVRQCAAAEAGGYGHGRVQQLLLSWQP